MAIKFVDGADVKAGSLVVVIAGQPGSGKTTLALTSDKPVLLDFDGGSYRAVNKGGKAIVKVNSWRDVESITAEDVAQFKTLVVDTVGSCLDVLSKDIIDQNPKAGRAGALTLQGFGTLKGRFKGWLAAMLALGLNVVLVAHGSEEQRGDETVDRIVAVGASKQEVYQQADLMGRLRIKNGTRVLSFDPTEFSYGKNVGLPETTIPATEQAQDVLGSLINEARRLINDTTDRQAEEYARLQGIREWVDGLETPDAFNEARKKMVDGEAPVSDKKLLVDRAKEKGMVYDTGQSAFVLGA